eukprot:3667848-Amphidinium_carterae.1
MCQARCTGASNNDSCVGSLAIVCYGLHVVKSTLFSQHTSAWHTLRYFFPKYGFGGSEHFQRMDFFELEQPNLEVLATWNLTLWFDEFYNNRSWCSLIGVQQRSYSWENSRITAAAAQIIMEDLMRNLCIIWTKRVNRSAVLGGSHLGPPALAGGDACGEHDSFNSASRRSSFIGSAAWLQCAKMIHSSKRKAMQR